jgi:TatA/E family protein of Tat protein translocase
MIIIVFVALLLFGGEKLPEIARGLGKGIREFKDASEGVKREINNQINSYEEKRTETSLNQAAQNQLSTGTGSFVENHPVVENTIPINENNFTPNESIATDNHGETHNEQVTENQVAEPDTNSKTVTETKKLIRV